MRKFLRNGFWIVIVQKVRKKCLNHSGKMHFSVSGHVTLGVVRWRHELDYICPLWVLSKFGPIEAYMCRVIANWFFPSNGIKRYFNGPLRILIYLLPSQWCFCMVKNASCQCQGERQADVRFPRKSILFPCYVKDRGSGSPSHNALQINYIINCQLSRDPLVVSGVHGVKSTVSWKFVVKIMRFRPCVAL